MKSQRIFVCACIVAATLLAGCETPPEPKRMPARSDTAPAPGPVTPAPKKAAAITSDGARNLANGCFACHGPNGRSPGYIPSLTTLSAADIAGKLKRFKQDEISSTIMGRQAKGFSDAEIDAIA